MSGPEDPSPVDTESQGCCASRREFLAASAAALGCAGALGTATPLAKPGWVAWRLRPGQGPGDVVTVPADKRLDPEWLRSLFERGEPLAWSGDELKWIGMPVGGICCGQLYLGGDGRLWHWDIFRSDDTSDYGGAGQGPHYAKPMTPSFPLEQGFALKITAPERVQVRELDGRGFSDVSWHGRYPIGEVHYRDPGCPITAVLEAFSPFVPLSEDDSGIPATVLQYTLRNTSDAPCEVEIAGWLENAVCPGQDLAGSGVRRNLAVGEAPLRALLLTAEDAPALDIGEARPDILIADFESSRYEGWTAEGDAFGQGPLARADMAPYHDVTGYQGERVAHSHNTRLAGPSSVAADRLTGTLTSAPFRIERRYLAFLINGGSHAGATEAQLLVDGSVVRTASGRNSNHMTWRNWDVAELDGQEAKMRLVDAHSGSWGNIGVDHVVQSDRPRDIGKVADLPGFGTMALSLLENGGSAEQSWARPELGGLDLSVAPGRLRAAAVFDALDPTVEWSGRPTGSVPFGARLVGGVGKRLTLQPGEESTVRFVLSWFFPDYHVRMSGAEMSAVAAGRKLRRRYAARYDSALSVARDVAERWDELAGTTLSWRDTWYDSTLPHWFLDRTFWNVSTLATQTCHRFEDGRFWGWEGVYCCPGTCQHVWQYAQSVARIFPGIERDLRERVDFGLAWHENGAQDYRAEAARHVAHDGLCGTIVRAWREHGMAHDDSWLRRIWPRVRKSLEFVMAQDQEADGLLEGAQYNTLDNTWYGPMGWISSLYLAAVDAGRAMAEDMGDDAFAARCRALVDRGSANLVERLFNGEYFIHEPDPEHPEATNTNQGCHIDQMLGQSFAWQTGLRRVVPAREAKSALRGLWKYSFAPDIGPYREEAEKFLRGGRWYALPGERGLLMCSWPRGGISKAAGEGQPEWAVAYFNECMTGFEYQVASHMIWEGMVEEGLAITRAIHDRYHPNKRNPFNEVECSDHYARAMASHGVFLAACGFEHHGPRGHLGFAPRLSPEQFRAAFVTAEGWGRFSQRMGDSHLEARIELLSGWLSIASISLELPRAVPELTCRLEADGRVGTVEVAATDRSVHILLGEPVRIRAGSQVIIRLDWAG